MTSNSALRDSAGLALDRWPLLLTVAEAAEALNVSVRMVRRLTSDGRLPAHHIGAHVRISRTDLAAFIDKARSTRPGR